MKTIYLLAAAVLAITPAAAQSIGEQTGVNSVLGISPSTQDFVTQAANGDMFEIQSSELAGPRVDEPTKAFAAQMVVAHTQTTEQLKALIASGTVQATPPAAMESDLQGKLDALKKLNGAEFKKQYLDDQIEVHKGAVSLFERYANGGDNSALKEWAGKTLPVIKHHLMMAEALAK